jgi:hypothetical protein
VIFLLNLFNIIKKSLSLYYKEEEKWLKFNGGMKARPNVGSIISLRVHAVNSILKVNSWKLII